MNQSTQRDDTNGKQRSHFESGAHETTFHKVQEQTQKVVEQAGQTANAIFGKLKPHFAPVDELFRKTTGDYPYLVVMGTATATFLTGFLTRRRTAMGAGVMLGFLAGCYLSTQSILSRPKGH